jgi:hypothetical protein
VPHVTGKKIPSVVDLAPLSSVRLREKKCQQWEANPLIQRRYTTTELIYHESADFFLYPELTQCVESSVKTANRKDRFVSLPRAQCLYVLQSPP